MRKGYLYILTTGVTSDLIERLEAHRRGTESTFTRKYGLIRLVYYELHDLIAHAIQRETSIKRWKRDWKIALIETINPNWDELDHTLV